MLNARQDGLYRRGGKRLLDLCGGMCLLLLSSPVMLLVATSIAFGRGGPVLFRQKRVGWGNRPFEMIKFRTMRETTDEFGNALPDRLRLSILGRTLRELSLDEIPQLWNVIKGDMSLVGPRPLLVEYLPLYSERQARRHEVRPGITGWAQVNGRNALTWEKKFEMDVWYVENVSFGFDLRILWMTLVAVVRRNGISAAGEATISRFRGTAP